MGVEPVVFRPIGVIHSEHRELERTPIQPVCAPGSAGTVEVFDEFVEGLDDVDGFSHIYLLYAFHQRPWGAPEGGALSRRRAPAACSPPARPTGPTPSGSSLVRLVERRGAALFVEDLDVLDGTPLLDIKPYVARFDDGRDSRGGWTDSVDEETFRRRGRRE